MLAPELRLATEAKLNSAVQQVTDAAAALYVAFRGPWAADVTYPANTLIIQDGVARLAVAEVPARAAFDSTDWLTLG